MRLRDRYFAYAPVKGGYAVRSPIILEDRERLSSQAALRVEHVSEAAEKEKTDG